MAREALISYSQNGEDVRLWRVFSEIDDGFYVDIGAAHPSIGSVTRLFYESGWSGVNVEPSPYFDLLAAERTRDVNLRVAVGAEDGDEVRFFVTRPDMGMSTLDPTSHAHVPETVEGVDEVVVPERRLATVMREHAAGRTIHFMKIDVEGAEREVLASSDWEAFRPLVLLIEAVEAWSTVPTHEVWEPILVEAGYLFATFDGINRFYVEGSHPELIEPLAYPLSALDVYTRADVHEERVASEEEVTRLEAELAETRRQLAEVRAQLDASSASGAGLSRTVGRPTLRGVWASKHRLYRPRISPVRAYESAVAPGQPWYRLVSESGVPVVHEDSELSALIACLGPPGQPLDRESAETLERAVVGTRWTDDDVLSSLRFSWEERQAIVETDALARLVRPGETGGRATARPAGEPDGEVVVDARCLQECRYENRSVRSHGRVVLAAARAIAPRGRLLLLTSAELPALPPNIAEEADEIFAAPYALRDRDVELFVELSPMAGSIAPVTPLLVRPECRSAAVVPDSIPTRYPDAHSRSELSALLSRVRIETLRHYDLLLPVSETIADACRLSLGCTMPAEMTGVADTLADARPGPRAIQDRYALIPTGGDMRTNVPAAIAAIALEGRRLRRRHLRAVVVGPLEPTDGAALRGLVESVGLPPELLELVDDVDGTTLGSLYSYAEVVVVPSVAASSSIAVVHAVRRGTPVVASDIPRHRELLGSDHHLVPPNDVEALARAINAVRTDQDRVAERQREALGPIGETANVRARVEQALTRLLHGARSGTTRQRRSGNRPRLAFVAPLPPQPTGVGDYTAYTLQGVTRYADVEVFTTAHVSGQHAFSTRPLSAAPYLDGHFDRVVSVLGNSHFHFPILDFLASYGSATIAHDTRMVEAYVLERGPVWAAEFLSTKSRRVTADEVGPLLDDMDRLPSTAYDMIAKQSFPLIVHGRAVADRIFRETGVLPEIAPFVPYNLPATPSVRAQEIAGAREALGLAEATYHLGAFGIVDRRTKGSDLIVSAVWLLRRRGIPVHLHVVGDAPTAERDAIAAIMDELGLESDVTMHGRVSHEDLVRFLLAVDVAVHLRTSGLLSLSGSVADCAAFGVPTVATRELVDELGAPEYFEPVDARTSPQLVADAVQKILQQRRSDPDSIEVMRRAYVGGRSLDAYARRLLDALGLAVT